MLASPSNLRLEPSEKITRDRRHVTIVMVALVFGLGGALAFTPIASAVIAGGEVTVESRVKHIAHPRGGVVASINVNNGDHVRAGQILLQFDTNISEATASMSVESITQLTARQARLRAERDGEPRINFPATLLSGLSDPEIARAVRAEQRIFMLDRQTLAGQRATLAQQIRQAEASIGGYNVQNEVYQKQAALIAEEKAANDKLWEQRYTTLQRRNELERAVVGLRGNAASTETSAAQLRAKIAELHERMLTLADNARREAGTQLSEIETRLIELRQNNIVAQDTNSRNIVRAPYDGVIDKLAYSTVGGVIPAGETIMDIVPDKDPILVSARVRANDIDTLREGEVVSLRFSGLNMQTTPQISGKLSKIAANRAVDQQSGVSFFPVEITIASKELAKLGDLKLRPGTPVEAFIRSEDRTLLGYIVKPLADQFARAFR